jgi:hypothetical protein
MVSYVVGGGGGGHLALRLERMSKPSCLLGLEGMEGMF